MCLQKEDEAKGGMEGRALSEKVNLCDCGALEGHGWLSLTENFFFVPNTVKKVSLLCSPFYLVYRMLFFFLIPFCVEKSSPFNSIFLYSHK